MTAKHPKQSRVVVLNWTEAEDLYKNGGKTVKEIARELGVAYNTVAHAFKKTGVVLKPRIRTAVKVGDRFGRLTVVERAGSRRNREALWRSVCDCGGETVVGSASLRRGHTKSCGCLYKETSPKNLTDGDGNHILRPRPGSVTHALKHFTKVLEESEC